MKKKVNISRTKGKIDMLSVILNIIACLVFLATGTFLLVRTHGDFSRFSIGEIVSFAVIYLFGIILIISLGIQHGRDPMTKLPNQTRFAFRTFLKIRTHKLSQFTAAFINLKDQSYTNRLVGKGNGDLIITRYAAKLGKFIAPGERIARLGGDNFIMLVYKHRVDELLEFLSGVKIPYVLEGVEKEIVVTGRAGLYSLSETDHVDDVFACSMIALNNAKKNKEDFSWFSKHMAHNVFNEKAITSSFEAALANNEFVVYYQPKIDVKKKEMYGAEALVRWVKDGKIVPPMDFVPVLEENRMIQKLDFYVLNQVCRDMLGWREQGLPIRPISINFSKYNLKDDRFSRNVIGTISDYKLINSNFEIELTETADCEDMGKLFSVMSDIHEAGVGTAIDDFGKGYSSLDLIKNVDVNIIKLDKSFVTGIDVNNGDNRDAMLVRNIIATCKELGKRIVCEGIETEEQRDIIKSMNCDYIQGFLYDKPMCEREFRKRLSDSAYDV